MEMCNKNEAQAAYVLSDQIGCVLHAVQRARFLMERLLENQLEGQSLENIDRCKLICAFEFNGTYAEIAHEFISKAENALDELDGLRCAYTEYFSPKDAVSSSPELTYLLATELVSKAPVTVQQAVVDFLKDFFERGDGTVSSKKLAAISLGEKSKKDCGAK